MAWIVALRRFTAKQIEKAAINSKKLTFNPLIPHLGKNISALLIGQVKKRIFKYFENSQTFRR